MKYTPARPGFKLEILSPDRYDEVLDFLCDHFFPDEITYKNFNVKRNPEIEQYLKKICEDNMSFICFHERSGEITGAFLTHMLPRGYKMDLSLIIDESFRNKTEFELTGGDEISSYLFDGNDLNEAVEFNTLSVHRDFRNQGIASWMQQASLAFVNELGFKAAVVTCSRRESKKVFEKQGFECIYDRPYNEWIKDGKHVFTDTEGNQSETVYGKRF